MSCSLHPKMAELVGDPVSPFPMQEQLLLIVNMQGAADRMRAQLRATNLWWVPCHPTAL